MFITAISSINPFLCLVSHFMRQHVDDFTLIKIHGKSAVTEIVSLSLTVCLLWAVFHLVHAYFYLRTFALIVSAHPYCARKSTCHVMHRARALSTKLNNDGEDGSIAIALIGFNDLGSSVTPTSLFRNRFHLQLSPHCPKMNKKLMWEVKKVSRFLSTGHGILPSFGCKGRETMVAKCQLVLWGTSPVD